MSPLLRVTLRVPVTSPYYTLHRPHTLISSCYNMSYSEGSCESFSVDDDKREESDEESGNNRRRVRGPGRRLRSPVFPRTERAVGTQVQSVRSLSRSSNVNLQYNSYFSHPACFFLAQFSFSVYSFPQLHRFLIFYSTIAAKSPVGRKYWVIDVVQSIFGV